MFVGVFALLAAALVVPATASADGVVKADGKFCAYNSVTGVMACVDALSDYPQAQRVAGVGTARGVTTPATQYLLARFFDHDDRSTVDGFIDYYGSATCTTTLADIDAQWSDTTTWRSRISSYQGYSNCAIKVFYNTGYTGTSLGYDVARDSVGSTLNDHIWSAQFS